MSDTVSTTKLFVGGLPWAIRGKQLREIFSEYGEVTFANVVLHQGTRKSKGYGFVEFANAEDAESAKNSMDGSELEERTIKVDFAVEKAREEAPAMEEEAPAEEADEVEENDETED